MTNQLPARPVEQVKDLADVPSFPAVYAAALTPRRGRETSRRDPVLPEVTYRVRSVRIDAERAASFDHLIGGPATELVRPGVLPEVTDRVRSVRLDAERAASFHHLMGGPATELVHPGVLHVLTFPVSLALMARGDFPFPLLGLVHLRNQVLQHRPVRVGEQVD